MDYKKDMKNCQRLVFALTLLIIFALPASAGLNFNYTTDGTPHNYTINTDVDALGYVNLIEGTIVMPSINLSFKINKTLASGSKNIVINSSFGPKTTSFPKQKVYIASGGTASVSYMVDASSTYFANTPVKVTTYRQTSNNVPFFSDFSIALLNFNDLKNTWNNDTKVLDELIDTVNDEYKIHEIESTLNAEGNNGTLSQSLAPGNYLILVTKGTNPKEIIASNVVKVMPFSSTVVVGDGSGFAPIGFDLNVNVTLSSSSTESYTYITSIINWSDYANNLGKINITWDNSQTLAQAARVNGTVLNDSSSLTDIIPRSNITRNTTSSKSVNLALKTGALPAGSYFVNTLVFNSTNLTVAFDQRLLTLGTANTTNLTGYINATTGVFIEPKNITTPNANITLSIPNNTKATLSDGVTPIANITSYTPTAFNYTLEAAASRSNLKFLGRNLTLLPAGAIFNPAIQVRFNYSDEDIPDGVSEDDLKAYWYNGTTGAWESLTTHEHNKSGNYLIANVTHFSTFALLGTVTTAGGAPSAPSGGGGGGGGVASGEDPKNIEKRETREEYLSKDIPASYKFATPEIPVREIIITANLNAGSTSALVELLKDTSKLVTQAAPGKVYRNVNIWVGTSGFATPKNIKEAIIKFRIENSWMDANNVQADDISMLRWDTAWSRIEAKETSRDANHTYFEAKTNAFSPFAISAKVPEFVPTVPGQAITPTVTPTVTPPMVKPPAIPAWVYILIAIVIIAGAAYFLVVRKKGGK